VCGKTNTRTNEGKDKKTMSDTLEVLFKGHIDPIEFIVPDADKCLAEIEVAIDDGMRTVALEDTHGDTILLVCAELQCCFVGETGLEEYYNPSEEVPDVPEAVLERFKKAAALMEDRDPATRGTILREEAKTPWRART
jgi:hypothetical protein